MSLDVYPINTGFFWLDGGAMFGVVPKVLWQKLHVPDEENRILQAMRSHLIVDGSRKLLIDVGIGNWHGKKFEKIYGVEHIGFDSALKNRGLSREDITDVILTHLHFDHAGGIATKTTSGIEPTFPNANIWVQRRQWEWANSPSRKDRASFEHEYLEMLDKTPLLKLVDGRGHITDLIEVIPVDGHTAGQQTVLAGTNPGARFFPSDLIPNASHIHVPFIMAYDNDPIKTADEKKLLLKQAQKENWTIHFYHDPGIEAGTVTQKDGRYTLGGI